MRRAGLFGSPMAATMALDDLELNGISDLAARTKSGKTPFL